MSYGTFLSTVAVVALLAGVALLVVLSALTLAPLDKFGRRSVVPFLISLVAIWAGAVFTIYLQTISKLSRSAIIAGDPYRKRSRDVREPAPAEAPSHHLASTRRVVGDHRTDPPRTRSTKEHRSSSRRPACRFGRDHLQDEKRGPVEPTARRVSRRLLGTQDLPEMDRAWRAGSHLGESHRALRGARWGGL